MAHLAESTLRFDVQEMRGCTGASSRVNTVRAPFNPPWLDGPRSLGVIRDARDVLLALFASSASRPRREHPKWFA